MHPYLEKHKIQLGLVRSIIFDTDQRDLSTGYEYAKALHDAGVSTSPGNHGRLVANQMMNRF